MAHLHRRRHLKFRNKFTFDYFALSASIVLVLSGLLCSCAKREAAKASVPQPSTADQNTAKVVQQSAPAPTEVSEAVTRVFKDAVTIDSRRQPNCFAGDFNGDASQDLAVFLQPASGKLAEMNQELPPWILKDPSAIPGHPAPPLRVNANELLLAIIHGYGPSGWRDAQATQTYLLKNAVGLEVKAYPRTEFVKVNQGKPLPRLAGDLIGANPRGKPAYLYFSGAQYSFYDPQTFKGEAAARVTHPGMMPKKNKFDLLHPKLVAAEKWSIFEIGEGQFASGRLENELHDRVDASQSRWFIGVAGSPINADAGD